MQLRLLLDLSCSVNKGKVKLKSLTPADLAAEHHAKGVLDENTSDFLTVRSSGSIRVFAFAGMLSVSRFLLRTLLRYCFGVRCARAPKSNRNKQLKDDFI